MGVIERLAEQLVDSTVPLERNQLEHAVRRLARVEAPLVSEPVLTEVVDSLVGMGPIEQLLRDPQVTDVLVNGPDQIWVERSGELQLTQVCFPSPEAVRAAVERMIAPLGLRLDHSSPMVDARLPDGSRLHAVIPPAALPYPVVAVRRFTPTVRSLDDLVDRKTVTPEEACTLTEAVTKRLNILVSGSTGAGKTTLLNVLSAQIPSEERIVVVEDASELALVGHVVRLEAKPPNAEGRGEVTLADLVRSALRLRPDRIVLGEVRGPEALDLVSALNTGHDGSMSTVHANSPQDALWRLETLAMSGQRRVSAETVRRQLHHGIDLIVQLSRLQGRRRVVELFYPQQTRNRSSQ